MSIRTPDTKMQSQLGLRKIPAGIRPRSIREGAPARGGQPEATQLANAMLRQLRIRDQDRTRTDGSPVLWKARIVIADAGDKVICLYTNDEDQALREATERVMDQAASEFNIPDREKAKEPLPRLGFPLVRVLFDPLL